MTKPGFWRRRNILRLIVGVPLIAFCVWFAWAVHWAYTAEPGNSVDYAAKVEQLIATTQADVAHEPNGWEELMAVCDLWQAIESSYRQPMKEQGSPPAHWPQGYKWPPLVSVALTANVPENVLGHARAMIAAGEKAGVFSRLRELRDHSHFAMPVPPGKLIDRLSSIQSGARELGLACAVRQRFAHQAGDEAAMLASFRDALTLSRAYGRQPGMPNNLTAYSLRRRICSEIRFELLERPPTDVTLRSLLQMIERQDREPRIDFLLESERLHGLDTIQWTHSDDGHGSGRLIPSIAAPFFNPIIDMVDKSSMPASRLGNLLAFTYPSKRETMRVVNDLYDDAIEQSKVLPANRQSPSFSSAIKKLPRKQFFARLYGGLLDGVLSTQDDADLDLASTRLMLAIEIHRARAGSPPASLADLVPGILPSLPIDPWNPDGFVYRPDASQPWGYVLYAKGADGVDDRAPYNPETNIQALKPEGAGTDFHFVYPR